MDQSIISRDVKVLKEMSQQFVFVFDLAKSDLAIYYKQSIDGIAIGLVLFLWFLPGKTILYSLRK
jgi:hypothetical protein